jgi:hypothetical protein
MDIEKVAVFDDRIVQTKPKYACEKGAVSLTNAPFNAISASASQHTYQIQVPSENVFVDRAIDWYSEVLLKVLITPASGVAPATGSPLLPFGSAVALSSFPLHTLVQTLTATINDTTTTINTGDVIREVTRLTDNQKNRSLRTTPTALDTYADYNDAIGAINNPLGGFNNSTESSSVPNGAYGKIQYTDALGADLIPSMTYTDDNTNVISVSASGVPQYITPVSGATFAWATATPFYVYIKFCVTEKIILSPFIFSDQYENEVGLFGVSNIQLIMNIASPNCGVTSNTATAITNGIGLVGRPLRFAPKVNCGVSGVYNVTSVQFQTTPFKNSRLNVQFLTPSLDLPLPPKSIVNYMEFPRYVTAVTPTWSAPNASGVRTCNSATNTVSLPCIPDLIILYAKPVGYRANEADYYLPITKISVNFDNFSGLLSSHTPEQLYAMTRANGLDMSYEQWLGSVQNSTGTSNGKVALTGGFLVLRPSRDITLSTGQSPSLTGQFTIQININEMLSNNGYNGQVNIWMITANSGFFETQRGSSRIIKGVLTEKDIIDAPLSSLSTRTSINRAVGGVSFKNMLGNAVSKVQEYLPIARNVASTIAPLVSQYGGEYGNKAVKYGNVANNVLRDVGLGRHHGHHGLQSRLM